MKWKSPHHQCWIISLKDCSQKILRTEFSSFTRKRTVMVLTLFLRTHSYFPKIKLYLLPFKTVLSKWILQTTHEHTLHITKDDDWVTNKIGTYELRIWHVSLVDLKIVVGIKFILTTFMIDWKRNQIQRDLNIQYKLLDNGKT